YEHVAKTALGRIELARGDLERARRLLLSSVGDFPGFEHLLVVAWAFDGLAEIAGRRGRYEEACALAGFATQVRATNGIAPALDAALALPEWFAGDRADQARRRGAGLELPEAVSCAAA